MVDESVNFSDVSSDSTVVRLRKQGVTGKGFYIDTSVSQTLEISLSMVSVSGKPMRVLMDIPRTSEGHVLEMRRDHRGRCGRTRNSTVPHTNCVFYYHSKILFQVVILYYPIGFYISLINCSR